MNSMVIINHSGSTGLLSKPVEERGKSFPFYFRAVKPGDRRWSYRLLPSDPAHLTDQQLTELLRDSRLVLRGGWEEQVGHPIGFITIYLPPKDGKSEAREGRFEQGPELGPDMTPAKLNVPQPTPPAGNHKRKTQDMSPDMF